jgi:hypothetical protein
MKPLFHNAFKRVRTYNRKHIRNVSRLQPRNWFEWEGWGLEGGHNYEQTAAHNKIFCYACNIVINVIY